MPLPPRHLRRRSVNEALPRRRVERSPRRTSRFPLLSPERLQRLLEPMALPVVRLRRKSEKTRRRISVPSVLLLRIGPSCWRTPRSDAPRLMVLRRRTHRRPTFSFPASISRSIASNCSSKSRTNLLKFKTSSPSSALTLESTVVPFGSP